MKGREHWTPGRILGVSGAYWQGCALQTAVKLKVFSWLEDEGATAEGLAERHRVNRRALTYLLNALAAMGLVEKEGVSYRCTDEARRFLVEDSSEYIGHMVMHHHFLVEPWSRLDEAVRTGRPTRRQGLREGLERESFLMGMFNLAMGIAPDLVKRIDLMGHSRLIDIGGGPGTYAIHFCLQNQNLRAVVFDLPDSRPFAEQTIARFGVQDRVRFAPGDYHSDPIAGSYDAAWLSHILHAEGPEGAARIVAKAVKALEPGGLLFIHEFIMNQNFDGPLFPALFALNMLVNTSEGRSYGQKEIRDIMADAGLGNIERLDFKGPNESGIMRGERL
ncbi:O-methyltransferase [uncultured Desulfatiglans sp.]|uniref:O-methyltransferase n=1 Tax=Uncultured Desulfatiglans sp. TaxID=1748965 RepID=A0A653A270_UNCDX|nr:O-methyltransferase [uncultured Desulfatiglans sp.]